MRVGLIGSFLVIVCQMIQLSTTEPLRVGIDVPEPKLLGKVKISYPEASRISSGGSGSVTLDILIDKKGLVAEVTEMGYTPSFLEAAKSAVEGWRFSPTFVNGKAVPVTAKVVVVFSLIGTPYPIDLGVKAKLLPLGSGSICRILATLLIMNHDGNLKELPNPDKVWQANGSASISSFDPEDGSWKQMESCDNQEHKYYRFVPELDAPFSFVEEMLKEKTPSSTYYFQAPQYRFPFIEPKLARPGFQRLYYSTLLVSNGSELIQLAGIDPTVQPPKFDTDYALLAESLNFSRYRDGAVFFFTILVDEKGMILGIEDPGGQNPLIVEALGKSRAITPGLRNGIPVPTAVILAIPVK